MAGFFVSNNVNFKEYFLREFIEDKSFDPYLSSKTGNHQHQSIGRTMRMGQRKSLNFVAKSQSQPKRAEHPKVDLCLRTKKDTPLSPNEAMDIMNKQNVYATPEERIKRFKKLPVAIEYIKPKIYVLRYNEQEENKWKV